MKLLVPGGRGMLGQALRIRAEAEGWTMVIPPRGEGGGALELRRPGAMARAVAFHRPDWIVNLAAYTDVDGAEREPELAFAINRDGAAALARAAAAEGIRMLQVSTDYVFDGTATAPIPVDAPLTPLNVYGRSKAEGEEAVRSAFERSRPDGVSPARPPAALVVRTSTLYGPGGHNFVDAIAAKVRRGEALSVVEGLRSQPTRTASLAEGLVQLIRAGAGGTLHLAGGGDATRLELATAVQRALGVERPIRAVAAEAIPPGRARRPARSVLDLSGSESLLGWSPPCWEVDVRLHLRADSPPATVCIP